MATPIPSRLLALGAITIVLAACGDEPGAGAPDGTTDPSTINSAPPNAPAAPADAEKLLERPWEIFSNKGEAYLPNVFYADAVQNEQIMPYALDGHVMIDRLIYPTLGNPNLYTKADAEDQFMVVLRIEDDALDALGVRAVSDATQSKRVDMTNDPANGFAFFLVPRDARQGSTEVDSPVSSGNGTGVYRVYPNEAWISPEPPDMPEALKKRHTVRFVFRQAAMSRVPAGLYDVRFEARSENRIIGAKSDGAPIYEYQYNAVRIFDTEPDEYSVINVTDTQVSVGALYDQKGTKQLDELVQYLNTTSDPTVQKAAFITFNGDLHNGGSPGTLREGPVAWTYHDEARSIVNLLKYLPLPIFLTAGNHDGYVAVGHVPAAVKALDAGIGSSLADVIANAAPRPWPDFSQASFDAFLDATAAVDELGGFHRDIFTGGFTRIAKGKGFSDGWKEVPRGDRNYIVYDGAHQWQKTYGPLYYSWRFGKNSYLSLNSYELRQHRRAGWGMYTVNYGGGMSEVQVQWVDRQLARAAVDQTDVIVLAHHDPRGGHEGQDQGYYFEQVEYRSIYQSAINYLASQTWNSSVCKLPPWALSRDQTTSCVHDGLQEWMRPDAEFDGEYASGMELMKLLAKSPQVRTLVLGHTHYNSLEVLQDGDKLLPDTLPIDAASAQLFATLEVENPVRGYSLLGETGVRPEEYDTRALAMTPLEARYAAFESRYERAIPGWQRVLEAKGSLPRELVVMRFVSNADLTGQTYSDGKSALGFSVLHLSKKADARNVPTAQINSATFFVNVGAASFTNLQTIGLDRLTRLAPHDPQNPVEQIYDW